MALEALQFGQRALELNTFARGDYKKVCELFVVYLGGEVNNFLFHQPGACHEARFLADALYLFTLQMRKKLTNIMNKEEEEMVQTSSFFISVCYAPWFLKSYIGFKAPANDLAAIKASAALKDDYPTLSVALTKSFMRHTWYLTEQLVVFALVDDAVEVKETVSMIEKLLDQKIHSSETNSSCGDKRNQTSRLDWT